MKTTTSFSLLSALSIGLLVACAGPGPSTSPTPSGSPTGSPTAPPSPTGSFGPDDIVHPTGPTDLVLQMETGGGFVPIDFFITQAPSFSLYGDGTVILRPTQVADRLIGPGGLPPFWRGHMTEEQVQALLRFALGQGRLLGARESYGQNMCADCPSTIFRLNAGGLIKTVTVDALGMVDGAGPDTADRAGFAALAETLSGFEARMQAGELGEVVEYDAALYRAVITEAQAGQREPTAWPWDDVTLDDFVADESDFQRVGILTREQIAELVEVPSGGEAGIVIEAADGTLWSLGFRPLLPDEVAAADQG